MVPTLQIQTALLATLRASGLLEKVMAHADADLGAALTHLRDHPGSLAVAVPGADTFEHQFEGDDPQPVRTELKCNFDLILSGRQLDKRETGDPRTLTLKDAVIELLLWNNLGIAGITCLPTICEPLAIEFENGKGREAWKLNLDFRQLIY